MRQHRLASVVRSGLMASTLSVSTLFISTLALTACQAPPKEPPPSPVTPSDEFPGIKSAYEEANPSSLMGRVAAVRAQDNMVLVSDIDAAKVAVGDPISVLDAHYQTLCMGTISSIVEGSLVVKCDAPTGSRGAAVGDLAVRAVSK